MEDRQKRSRSGGQASPGRHSGADVDRRCGPADECRHVVDPLRHVLRGGQGGHVDAELGAILPEEEARCRRSRRRTSLARPPGLAKLIGRQHGRCPLRGSGRSAPGSDNDGQRQSEHEPGPASSLRTHEMNCRRLPRNLRRVGNSWAEIDGSWWRRRASTRPTLTPALDTNPTVASIDRPQSADAFGSHPARRPAAALPPWPVSRRTRPAGPPQRRLARAPPPRPATWPRS